MIAEFCEMTKPELTINDSSIFYTRDTLLKRFSAAELRTLTIHETQKLYTNYMNSKIDRVYGNSLQKTKQSNEYNIILCCRRNSNHADPTLSFSAFSKLVESFFIINVKTTSITTVTQNQQAEKQRLQDLGYLTDSGDFVVGNGIIIFSRGHYFNLQKNIKYSIILYGLALFVMSRCGVVIYYEIVAHGEHNPSSLCMVDRFGLLPYLHYNAQLNIQKQGPQAYLQKEMTRLEKISPLLKTLFVTNDIMHQHNGKNMYIDLNAHKTNLQQIIKRAILNPRFNNSKVCKSKSKRKNKIKYSDNPLQKKHIPHNTSLNNRFQ